MAVERSSRKTFLIIWGALLWSLFLFFYLVYSSGSTADGSVLINEEFLPGGQTHTMFTLISAVVLVVSFVLPRFLFHSVTSKLAATPTVNLLLVPWIMRMALGESISLFGFVLGSSSGSVDASIPFFVATLLIYALHFPSNANVTKWLETRRF